MESRAAAENVILRLNGKNVRGWDGTESRVYLVIADTLDQRELRVRAYRPSSYSCHLTIILSAIRGFESGGRSWPPDHRTGDAAQLSCKGSPIPQFASNLRGSPEQTRRATPSRSHGCDGPRSADGESGGGPAPSSPCEPIHPRYTPAPPGGEYPRPPCGQRGPEFPPDLIPARPVVRPVRVPATPAPASEYAPQPRGAIRVLCGDAAARSAAAGVSSPGNGDIPQPLQHEREREAASPVGTESQPEYHASGISSKHARRKFRDAGARGDGDADAGEAAEPGYKSDAERQACRSAGACER
jgi:hypothetical protein